MAKAAIKAKSGPTIFDCEQGATEWFQVRLGLPTASVFSVVMAGGRDGGTSITRTKLLHRLAGEIITGEPAVEEYRNGAMDRGRALEDEARQSYARRKKVDVQRIGFVRNFDGLKCCGASPDGFVGFDGGLELKVARPDVLIALLEKPPSLPPEHRAQVQGNMMVCERDWWDLSIYSHPKIPALDIRVGRDDRYIKEMHNEIEIFNYDLRRLVERLRKMGAAG